MKDDKTLKDRARELVDGCELMVGRSRGELEELIGKPVTIVDYNWLTDTRAKTESVVFILAEDERKYFVGSAVLTEKINTLEAEGYHDQIATEGLPVLFGSKARKNPKNKAEVTFTFYPEEQDSTR